MAPLSLFEEEGGEELIVPMQTVKILEQVRVAAVLLLLLLLLTRLITLHAMMRL